MKRNTMDNHLKLVGPAGFYTKHAGLTVEQAIVPGVADEIRRSHRHEFKVGDWVTIRGTTVEVPVKAVNGVFLTLRSYGWGGFREFHSVNPPHGRYRYGDIEIYKSYCIPMGGFADELCDNA